MEEECSLMNIGDIGVEFGTASGAGGSVLIDVGAVVGIAIVVGGRTETEVEDVSGFGFGVEVGAGPRGQHNCLRAVVHGQQDEDGKNRDALVWCQKQMLDECSAKNLQEYCQGFEENL